MAISVPVLDPDIQSPSEVCSQSELMGQLSSGLNLILCSRSMDKEIELYPSVLCCETNPDKQFDFLFFKVTLMTQLPQVPLSFLPPRLPCLLL